MRGLTKVQIPNGIIGVKARYTKQIIYDYKDNPLIEALPKILDKENIIDELSNYPIFNEEERELEGGLRYHITQRLFQYFQPLNRHVELYNKINLMIRQGYITRNPTKKEFANVLNTGYKAIMNNNIEINKNVNFKNSALGLTLFGISGAGKTTAVDKILSTLPQVIVHSKYKRKQLMIYQIVWLKVEIPNDGSIKSFCLSVFSQVDGMVGTDYFKKYGSGYVSANVMLTVIVQIFRNLNCGILIIDEVQNLHVAHSGGAEKLINFFLLMVNTINVPILLIGTPLAIHLLQGQFRVARRNSSLGSILWDRLENDEEFELLLEGLWQYQWTKKTVELNKKMIDLLYYESQGIIDVVIKIFVMAQQKAINTGKEEIDEILLRSIVKEELQLIKPMLDALKSGDINKISKYSDIDMPKIRNYDDFTINLNYKNKEKNDTLVEFNELLDVNVNNAEKERKVEIENRTKRKNKNNNYNTMDLRFIVKEAKEKEISIYDNLKWHRIIKSYADFQEEIL